MGKGMESSLKKKLPGGKFENVRPKHRRIMQGVRGKGNRTTEKRFRGALIKTSIRGWKLNYKEIKGSPDFYFPIEKVAVFLDGCFWHGCDKCGHVPKKNSVFWSAKFARNKERDELTNTNLEASGILVLRFWEHEIKESLESCISKLLSTLKNTY